MRRLLPLLAVVAVLSACGDNGVTDNPGKGPPPDGVVACSNNGEYCHDASDCCGAGDCQPLWVNNGVTVGYCFDGTAIAGGKACGATTECYGGMTCNGNNVCTDGSALRAGARCSSSSDCAGTLTCEPIGVPGVSVCSDGTPRQAGALCKDDSDCDGVLTCNGNICQY